MTPQQEEAKARARHRALAKARRVAAANRQKRRREEERTMARYRSWLGVEKRAYEAHLRNPSDRELLRKWVLTWRDDPTYEEATA